MDSPESREQVGPFDLLASRLARGADRRTPADDLAVIAVSIELDAMDRTSGHSERTLRYIKAFSDRYRQTSGIDVGVLVAAFAHEFDLDASEGAPRPGRQARAAYAAVMERLMPREYAMRERRLDER